MRKLFAVCAVVLALTVAIVLPCAAVETTAEPETPAIDWSGCYVTCYSNGIANTKNLGNGIYSGCVVSSATAAATIVPAEFSFDSATGVLTCSGKSTALSSYLLLSGLNISNITVTAGAITVSEATAPEWSEYYFSTGVPDAGASGGVRITTHSATELGVTIPDDVTWVRISSSSNAWYHFTLTLEPAPAPSSFDNVLTAGQTLFAAMLGYGSAFIDFFVARPILIIPLALYVLVALYGFFKSLLVGVK